MGGRAAEELIFCEISTGASDDLQRATQIAEEMVTRYGMSSALGNRVYAEPQQRFLGEAAMPSGKDVSQETAREIDLAVKELVEKAYQRAKAILTEKRADLEAGAALLLERETLTDEDFAPIRSRLAAMRTDV